jgi:hypothetical protein
LAILSLIPSVDRFAQPSASSNPNGCVAIVHRTVAWSSKKNAEMGAYIRSARYCSRAAMDTSPRRVVALPKREKTRYVVIPSSGLDEPDLPTGIGREKEFIRPEM